MNLQKIITLANEAVRPQFELMLETLRVSGCSLEVWVIPYDDKIFSLPHGCRWWLNDEIFEWLREHNCHPSMRKYLCLTTSEYQFVDTDVIFLRNPQEVLSPYSGFVTSCGHWRDTSHTCTRDSESLLKTKGERWKNEVFNSGQFACDIALFNSESLKFQCEQAHYKPTCIDWPHNEQPGMNLLVGMSKIQITNLTLPPISMRSTWAGDYPNQFPDNWEEPERKPYLIHWAGLSYDLSREVDRMALAFIDKSQRSSLLNSREKRTTIASKIATVFNVIKANIQKLKCPSNSR
ncbi:MAG: hypothetical protein KDD53_00895, partial [Bdellovibrionales bacterium]|nr:hypothetical protein [Bdellovibrionales bacterium]